MSVFARVQVRRIFRVVNGGTPTTDPMNWDGDVPWATPVDLAKSNGRVILTTQRQLTDQGLRSGSVQVPQGSVLVSNRAPIGYVALAGEPMAFNQGCKGLIPRHSLDPRYFVYQLGSLTPELESRGQGSTFLELSADALAATSVALPPLATQRAIADYLDAETARIDALIEKKRRIIELLEERWNATISAVTEVDERVRVRHVTTVRTSGPRGWADLVSDDGSAAFIRAANLRRDAISLRSDNLARLSPPENNEAARSRAQEGDVLVGITGANTGWIGIVDRHFAGGFVSQHVAILRPVAVNPSWLAYSLFARKSQEQLVAGQYGGTKQQLGLDDLAEVVIGRPRLRDQSVRVARLEELGERHDLLRNRLEQQVNLLGQRRQALITAAVTGETAIPGATA